MKRKNTSYAVIAIAFILFNVIAFAIPSSKTASFWIAYVFSVIAFAVQAFVWKLSFGSESDLRSKFFKIPVVKVGITYLVVQMIAFVLFMICSTAPVWIPIIVCTSILCVAAIGLITTEAAIDDGLSEVARIDEKIAVKRQYIKELLVEVEILEESENNAELKEKLKALAKKIHLSDPMSSESLADIEERLSNKIFELKAADSDKDNLISEAEILLLERNKRCKMLKG